MEIEEIIKYREDLVEDSKDEDGFISEPGVLNVVLPLMYDAKLLDSEECTDSPYNNEAEKIKINGYSINESGERLQLFIVNSDALSLGKSDSDLSISQKSYYDELFNKAVKFINKAFKGHLDEMIQDGDPVKSFVSYISSSEGLFQIDVIEIFLVTATATIESRGAIPRPKRIDFEDDRIQLTFTKNREPVKKEFIVIKKLIDLNFLYNVIISQGNREALVIDFEEKFSHLIPAIQAADEENFESFLCVLPAKILAELYKRYSSRLLEKNVRSFLEFKGVNQGIRDTIRKNPEKFIAYNNGLTITATHKELINVGDKIFIKSLTDFQIVNGGQTTASIYFTSKDGADISKVRVMAKINIAKEISEEALDEMISRISEYSNSQSKVSKVDLRSRSPQLNKLKSLSESVVTPNGLKWFFEKSRGEFNTMLRLAGKNRTHKENEYPKQRRFTKEDLGKYFCAWGAQPYMIKKGGEKVFRYFIEAITDEKKGKKGVTIDRDFYEELISRIILFRTLEKIYGQGKYSMGQLRSAVVPYSISVLYNYTSADTKGISFDLRKIWIKEGLENDLIEYMKDLMFLMNDLIKNYSGSEDYGEYSKRKDLWDRISDSQEVKSFLETENSLKILIKYTISNEELNKRIQKSSKELQVDFKSISDNIKIASNGSAFYSKIGDLFIDNLTKGDCLKIESIISSIIHSQDIDLKHIAFENDLIHKIRSSDPEIFDKSFSEQNVLLQQTLDFIIKTYNNAIENQIDVLQAFEKIQALALAKGIKYASVFHQIGDSLKKGNPPTVKQIRDASYYLKSNGSDLTPKASSQDIEKLPIDLIQLKQMVEWDSKYKVLTNGERQYIADLAFGMKKLNPFHEANARKHLQTLIKAGFNINSQ